MSSTSNAPAPTSISSCIPTAIESFDTSGLSGLVCGISAPPAVHNISSCCATDTWKVESNCTQYCEAHDASEFNDCVNEHRNFLIDSGSNGSSLLPIYNSLCLSGSDSGDEDGTVVIADWRVFLC